MSLSSMWKKLNKRIDKFYDNLDDFGEKREIKRIEQTKLKRKKLEVQAKRAKVEKAELERIRAAEKIKGERDDVKAKLSQDRVARFGNKFGSLGDRYFKEDNLDYHKNKKNIRPKATRLPSNLFSGDGYFGRQNKNGK